jgi:hypothetical protein
MDDKLHFGMPGGIADNEDEGDESDECNVIPPASRRPRPLTEFPRCQLGTSDVNGYDGEDGDNADEEEETSPADDGSTQNVED